MEKQERSPNRRDSEETETIRYGNSLRATCASEDLEQAIPQVGSEDMVQHVTQEERLVVEVIEVFNEVNEIRELHDEDEERFVEVMDEEDEEQGGWNQAKNQNRASRCGVEAMQRLLC
ncbi:unnamed protein product [Cylicocyclus nassatus]|uniref:Uncharacterized protein n=1 Tax=Cylicocyclus nassatus TaxID=53992 RepID=A0AA36GP12_CYLNA|nr:unnamed protein product [Cylicocyclus nassatus]